LVSPELVRAGGTRHIYVIVVCVIRDAGVGGNVGLGGDLLDVIEVGEGAIDLRCLPRYFDVFVRLELVEPNAKYEFSARDCGAGDIWLRHDQHPFRQMRIG